MYTVTSCLTVIDTFSYLSSVIHWQYEFKNPCSNVNGGEKSFFAKHMCFMFILFLEVHEYITQNIILTLYHAFFNIRIMNKQMHTWLAVFIILFIIYHSINKEQYKVKGGFNSSNSQPHLPAVTPG